MKDINIKNLTIAHRGIFDNEETPENSLKSFKKAIDKNYPIELDITLTKDNYLMVFHDPSLLRMTGVDKLLEKTSYEEVKKLKLLNTKEHIPTIKEVLDLVNGKVLIDIEIKTTKKTEIVVTNLLKELENYQGDIIIKSFNPKIVRLLNKKQDKYLSGLLLTEKFKNNFLDKHMNINFLIKYTNPDFISVSKKLIKHEKLKKYINKLPILIWTIKTEDEFKKMHVNDYTLICNNLETKKD